MKNLPLHTIYIILFLVMGVMMQNFQETLVFSQEKISSGEVWRIWSGQFVHINYLHLLLNGLGFGILIFLYQHSISTTQLFVQIVYLASCIGLSLYFFSPKIQLYAGFSGILYGLFIIAAIQAHIGKDYLLSYPVFLIITGKIIWDKLDNTDINFINITVADNAHIYGYLSALIFGFIIALKSHKQEEI